MIKIIDQHGTPRDFHADGVCDSIDARIALMNDGYEIVKQVSPLNRAELIFEVIAPENNRPRLCEDHRLFKVGEKKRQD